MLSSYQMFGRVTSAAVIAIASHPRHAPSMPDHTARRIVFSDFDGTITAVETFFSMLQRFTPELTAELVPAILDYRISLRDGVRRLVETIPSAQYPQICEHAQQAGLRRGFTSLLDYLEQRGVDLVIVSSGLYGMIDAALGSLAGRARAIVAADVDCSGPTLRLRSEFERADEIVAKVEVMRRFPADESVAIGDSITDVEMSLAADVVFARDWLAEHLRGRGVAFESWEDFHDIRDALQQRWEGCC